MLRIFCSLGFMNAIVGTHYFIRARQGRKLKKIWNLVAKDLWIVLLDIIAVNAAYYLALLIRFFGDATYGIFNLIKPQYMVV